MKTAKLKNGLICVSVPMDATDFEIKHYGYAGKWIEESNSKNFNAWKTKIDNNFNYQILGTITANECSFDCKSFIDDSEFYAKMWKNYNPVGKPSAKSNQCSRPLDSFKSMIESETDFLFENPIENPNLKPLAYFGAIDLKADEIEVWTKYQSRVIEKILILKTI